MSSRKRPSLTRLLGTENAADLNVLLTGELCLSDAIVQSCNSALDHFIEFLKNKLKNAQSKFKEIIVGGSLGTKTEINSEDDVDVSLHVMLDCGSDDLAHSVAEFKESLSNVIQCLKECVKAYGNRVEMDDVSDTEINCTLNVADCPVDVEIEIFPSLSWNVEDDAERDKLYEQMIDNVSDRWVYATTLCGLQINYIKNLKNTRVTNLIRLAKFWRQRAFSDDDDKLTLPSAYSLQFLVISLWERAGKPETFKPSIGFKAMMEEIQNYTEMYIMWNVYYSKDKVQRALLNNRYPILMDPCDPTRNLAAECNCWNDVAMVALATLGKPMVKDVSPNPRWQ